MIVRNTAGAVRWSLISAMHRRNVTLPDIGPIVTFTFDDFPRSAFTVGGSILKSHGASGTYYAAFGLMGKVTAFGEHFSLEDLNSLLRYGHELGSHTFSHLSARTVSLTTFEEDVEKGRNAVAMVSGVKDSNHFSYPYGHATVRTKKRIGAKTSSCRSIVPGINTSPIDLNLLRANSLYSSSFDHDTLIRLMKSTDRQRAWLIWYTHDISECPSPFGCTPDQLEQVVSLARKMRATILPVGKVVSSCLGLGHQCAHDY